MKKSKLTAMLMASVVAASLLCSCGGTYTSSSLAQSSSSTPAKASSSSASKSEVASSAASTPTTTSGASEFTFISTQPNTLNMVQSVSNLDSYAFYLTQEMLFRPYQGKYSPEAVESWEVDDTHTVYTYHLKETFWPDGTPITAQDFAFYLLARISPAMGSGAGADLVATYSFLNGAKFLAGECDMSEVGIKALDDKTLQITLEEAKAEFDGTNITVYPLKQSFFEAQGEAMGGTVDNYMSSGPYILKEWVYDGYLTYEKNPGWVFADEQFPVEKVTMVQATDPNTSISMLEGGEVDCIQSVQAEYISLLADNYDLTSSSMGSVQAVQFNKYREDPAKAALLSNKNFQMALSYALNRAAIVPAIDPTNTPINRFVFGEITGKTPDTLFAEDYPMETVPMEGDVEKAKAYLKAALDELGYTSVDQLPTVNYLTFENAKYRLTAETLVDQWKQVLGLTNIAIDLKPIPDAIQAMMSYQYDIYYTSMSSGTSPSTFMDYWTTTGGINDITGTGNPLWSNEEFDTLVKTASSTMDREERMNLYAKAEQIILSEGALIPIQTQSVCSACAKYVSGFVYSSMDGAIELNYLKVDK